jgi:putative PIN family toxin of toxin-antitoxin system
MRPAYVLDTDVLVAALRSDGGASRQLLLAALDEKFELLLSVPLVLEYEGVLTRPEHLAACGLRSQEVERILDDLISIATPVNLDYRWRPTLRDPNDDMVLETALNGNANAIVTFNLRDFAESSRILGCSAILPEMALRQMRSSNP